MNIILQMIHQEQCIKKSKSKSSSRSDWKTNYDDYENYDDGGDDLNFDYSEDRGYYDEDYFD